MGVLQTGVSWDANLNDGADCPGFAKQMHELVMQLCGRLFVDQNSLCGRLLHQHDVGDPPVVLHMVCHLKNPAM
jgi:hypothetical protein